MKKTLAKSIRSMRTHSGNKFLAAAGYPLITYSNLLDKLSLERGGVQVCHIIGSGWSFNKTKNLISDDDHVFGFNFAGFSDLQFKFYFFENSLGEIGRGQVDLLNATNIDNLVLKNIWSKNIDLSNLKLLEKDFFYIVDKWIIFDILNPLPYVEKVLGDRDNFCQIGSTFLSLLCLAIHLGYRKIHIHGVDFMGEHFFHSDNFEKAVSISYGSKNSVVGKHDKVPSSNSVGTRSLLTSTYFNHYMVYDLVLLRSFYTLALDMGVDLIAHAPSTLVNALRS